MHFKTLWKKTSVQLNLYAAVMMLMQLQLNLVQTLFSEKVIAVSMTTNKSLCGLYRTMAVHVNDLVVAKLKDFSQEGGKK